MRHFDPHSVLRPAEQARDFDAHEGRALRGRIEGHPPVTRIGDCNERLHRRMHDRLGLERVFEDMIGRREAGLGIAAQQMIIQRNIGAAAGP